MATRETWATRKYTAAVVTHNMQQATRISDCTLPDDGRRPGGICGRIQPHREDLHHFGFPDPAAATGTEEVQRTVFREVRDAIRIREQVVSFLASPQEGPPAGGFDLRLNL